jgi:hypothetical protein
VNWLAYLGETNLPFARILSVVSLFSKNISRNRKTLRALSAYVDCLDWGSGHFRKMNYRRMARRFAKSIVMLMVPFGHRILRNWLLQVLSEKRYYFANTVVPGLGITAGGCTTPSR